MNAIRKVIAWVLTVTAVRQITKWLGYRTVVEPEVNPSPIAEPQSRPTRVKKAKIEEVGDGFIWDFKNGILDRLDEYCACMRKMRQHDPDSYDLYSRVGLSVSASRYVIADLDSALRIPDGERVAIGGILVGTSDRDTDMIIPSFIYFQKLNRPSQVQWKPGDPYRVVAIYDDRVKGHPAWPLEFHVVVDKSGDVHPLKQVVHYESTFKPKGSRKNITLSLKKWDYSVGLKGLVQDRQEREQDATCEMIAKRLFMAAYLTSIETRQRIVVRARRRGITAAFGIDVKRAKTFFKDRDTTVLASDGKRKRIFHSVSQHMRLGRIPVRFHYRGLRHFDWNDYGVSIVFPKNNWLIDMPIPATYEEDAVESANMTTMQGLGKELDKRLSA